MAGDLVLLTGSTGMIGFKILTLLLEAGYTVRAAVRNEAGFDRISALPAVQPFKSQLSSFIVPDITVPGAYDEAVKGVKYILHVASPLASNAKDGNYEEAVVRPAIQGTVGILESAIKTTGIKRVIITASVASLASSARLASGKVVDESTLDVQTEAPYANEFAAYSASKALAYQATKDFIATKKPAFDVINILPVFVLGRDVTVNEASGIAKGTNGLLMGPILGYAREFPLNGTAVHVDDVAKMHVLALDPKIEGNQDFLAAGPNMGKVNWAESFEIVKRRYPKEYAEGVFKFDSIPKPPTTVSQVDNAKARTVLGVEFKTYEDQIVSLVDHYLELLGRK